MACTSSVFTNFALVQNYEYSLYSYVENLFSQKKKKKKGSTEIP